MHSFAQELKRRVTELQLSQAEIARRSGVTSRAFNHYLIGRSEPKLATLLRIAAVLNCTPNDLLGVGTATGSVGKKRAMLSEISCLCATLNEKSLRLSLYILRGILAAQGAREEDKQEIG
jgi:transcriptional regulator with XRE-family HTH domain